MALLWSASPPLLIKSVWFLPVFTSPLTLGFMPAANDTTTTTQAQTTISPGRRTSSETQRHSLQSSLPADVGTLLADDRQLVKDTRSYEHNRQRLKKAMDLVKRKARKARRASADPTASPSAPLPSEKEKHLWADDVDPLRDVKVPDIVESPVGKDLASGIRNSMLKGEVKLSDLIVTGKPRKVKDGDFEMIPRVRSVIVLDEVEDFDSELDEPWEHVLKEDKQDLDSVKKASYAEIVSTN